MFNFFKKKNEEDVKRITEMCLNVFSLMTPQYIYIENQLKDGIIIGVRADDAAFKNYTNFSLNVKILNKYENKKGPVFIIKGIKIYDIGTSKFTDVYFYIGYGLLLGYSTPGAKKLIPDINRIDVRQQHNSFFENDEFNSIKHLFDEEELSLLNPNDVYEVKLKGKVYYHLKDLEDGDFIGIDNNKKIYKITHDPLEIKEQSESLSELLT